MESKGVDQQCLILGTLQILEKRDSCWKPKVSLVFLENRPKGQKRLKVKKKKKQRGLGRLRVTLTFWDVSLMDGPAQMDSNSLCDINKNKNKRKIVEWAKCK